VNVVPTVHTATKLTTPCYPYKNPYILELEEFIFCWIPMLVRVTSSIF